MVPDAQHLAFSLAPDHGLLPDLDNNQYYQNLALQSQQDSAGAKKEIKRQGWNLGSQELKKKRIQIHKNAASGKHLFIRDNAYNPNLAK